MDIRRSIELNNRRVSLDSEMDEEEEKQLNLKMQLKRQRANANLPATIQQF
jgi:hypothetical protein